MNAPPHARDAWPDAILAAALVAMDGARFGGVVIRARHGPVRERWQAMLAALLAPGTPLRKLPANAGDDRLIGGLDLAASLQAGRPVAERGLLAGADGGVLVVPMAERLGAATAARLGATIDTGHVSVERDGLRMRLPTRFATVAFDEAAGDEGEGGEGGEGGERPPSGLLDRLALHVDLSEIAVREAEVDIAALRARVTAGRAHLQRVALSDDVLQAICTTAVALGIGSLRAPLFAATVARMIAALDGRAEVSDDDAVDAARLVLAPRATQMPEAGREPEAEAEPAQSDEREPDEDTPREEQGESEGEETDSERDPATEPLDEIMLTAVAACLPDRLLAGLRQPARARAGPKGGGRAGATAAATRRHGRPIGARPGTPRDGARLDLIATLRAAAPWQRLRAGGGSRAEAGGIAVRDPDFDGRAGIAVRAADFRVSRRVQRSETTTIFVVDASGSSALHRLAEAKGAVELLLADCYVRRDHVALIAFRGTTAELALPATRSLFRAKRNLAGMMGGGGTPLATALRAAAALAEQERRRDRMPVVALLTDGRGNITLDGRHDRPAAMADATDAARAIRADRLPVVLIDTGPRPDPRARALAEAMAATYLPMPLAGAGALSAVARGALAAERTGSRGAAAAGAGAWA